MTATVTHLSHTDIAFDSRILKEMNALKAAGYDVRGYGVSLDEETAEGASASELDIVSVVSATRRIGRFLPKAIKHILVLFEIYLRFVPLLIRSRPAVIHCHDVVMLPLAVATKTLVGSHLIYDAHELESDRNGIGRWGGRLIYLVERILWRWVDEFITVSESIEKWYVSRFGRKNSTVIFNSPLIERGTSETQSDYFRSKFGIEAEKTIFVTVGQFSDGRGVDILLEVFSQDDIGAVIIFMGFGERVSQIQSRAASSNNIFYHQAVPHEHVVPFCTSADCGICLIEKISLSDYFSLPNKLFEYSFAELPILASDFPEIVTVVERYNLGITTDVSVKSVRGAIQQMISQRTSFSVAADSLVDLCWETQENKLRVIYQRLDISMVQN